MAKGRYGKMTVKEAIEKLKAVDVVIRRVDGNEFRVNFRGSNESTAYYTNDLDDAVGTGLSMARQKQHYEQEREEATPAGRLAAMRSKSPFRWN
jgi:hypothetical protein